MHHNEPNELPRVFIVSCRNVIVSVHTNARDAMDALLLVAELRGEASLNSPGDAFRYVRLPLGKLMLAAPEWH